jgi:hypothetical protein
MSRGRRAVVLIAIVAALAGLRYVTSIHPQRIETYWLVDEATLRVQVVSGPQHSCSIRNTVETTSDVRIEAECREPFIPLPSTAIGILYCFDARLQTAIGERVVIDGLGNTVPRSDRPPAEVDVCHSIN